MKTKSRKNSWLRGWRNGLTLIEVVVGIAIAGTLLVSTIMATTAHRRQVKLANTKRQALQMLDSFLAAWSQFDFDAADTDLAARHSGVRLAIEARLARQSEATAISVRTVDVKRDLDIEIVRAEVWGSDPQAPITWVEIARPKDFEH